LTRAPPPPAAAAGRPRRATTAAPRRPRSRRSAGGGSRVLAVPRDRPLEPVTQGGARLEAEQLSRAAPIETGARLAVRHRAVPLDLAIEAGQLRDQLGQIPDRDL